MNKVYGIVGILLGILISICYPVFLGKTTLNANHLVAFYQPWASSPELGWGISSIHHKPVGDDDLWIFYPQRTFTMRSFARFHEIPFWNPLSFSGNHQAGLSETAIFYPLNILFFLFPQPVAWILLTLMQPLLVGIGLYLFLRLILPKRIAAVYGAIVFSFSSVVLVRMVEGLSVGHALLWLPFVLWSVEVFAKRGRLRHLLFLTCFLVGSLAAGWLQYTFYIVAVGVVYAAFRCARDRRQWPVFVPFAVFPLLSLFHLIPAVMTFLESPRGQDTNRIVQYLHLVPPQHMLTLLFPDFWGNPGTFNFFGPLPYKEALFTAGIIPLALAIVGLTYWRKYAPVRFFGGVLAVCLIVGVDSQLSRFIVSLPIPIVSTFIPSRIFTLGTFALAVLSAYGLLAATDVAYRRTVVRIAVGVASVAAVCAAIIWGTYFWSQHTETLSSFARTVLMVGKPDHLRSQARNTLLPVLLIGSLVTSVLLLRKKQFVVIVAGIIMLLTVGQLWYNARKYLAFSETAYVYPPHPLFTELMQRVGHDRFVSLGTAHIATNIPLEFGLPSIEGAGSMYIQRYGELLSYVTDPQHRFDQVLRIESYINPTTRKFLRGDDPVMQRFLEISGVRFFTSLDNDRDAVIGEDIIESRYANVWQQGHWQLWEDAETLPRTFVTGDFSVRTTGAAILSDIFSKDSAPRHVTVEIDPGIPPSDASGSAAIERYTPNTVTIRVTATAPALVYLSDTFSRTFRATVDGKPTPLLRANYAFRAVAIPAGTHTVTMFYDTTPWVWGTGISIGLWVVGGVVMWGVVRAKRMFW